MKIIITESTIVHPAQDTPNQHLWLSTLDLLQRRNHVHVVYIYKPTGSSKFLELRVLKEALSKVLVLFYPVAGRLGRDKKGRIEINCNGAGVLFTEAETDSDMAKLGDFMPSNEVSKLIPTVDNSHDISSDPLLVLQVQVTTSTCSGVCLGVGWNHMLADGVGAHFFKTWSNVAHGLSISNPPYIKRTILTGQVPPTPTFHHIEYDPPPTMNMTNQNPESQSGSKANSMANLKITLEQLNTLKAQIKNINENKMNYSTYEILTAHIRRCASKACSLSYDQPTQLRIAVDGQSRLHPPLPLGYFSNVVFCAAAFALSGELLSEPLLHTVERIHKAKERMNDKYLRSALDYLDQLGDVTAVMAGAQTCRCPNLSIISWMHLPFHDADFGWSQLMYVRHAQAFEGKGYILPSPANQGSFSLAICLETNYMNVFHKLFYDFLYMILVLPMDQT